MIIKKQNKAPNFLPNELDFDWPLFAIDEVAEVNPKFIKSIIPDNLSVSFVPMHAVGAGDGTIKVTETRPAGEVIKGFTNFKEGDVLFAKITPCMENGKIAVVPKLINGYGFGSTEFHVLRPKPGVVAKYLYYFLSREFFRSDAKHYMTGAVGQKRVPTNYLKQSFIPIPPVEYQKHLVGEIEKQFSRLDEAVAGLKRAKTNLKRYKAAILKSAVEGRLTEQWRKEHPDVEPAEKLLQRILAERRAKWEKAELAKMKAKGKKSEERDWRKNYQEPNLPGDVEFELPEGWTLGTIRQLSQKVQYGTSSKATKETKGVPILRMGNIVEGELSFDDLKYLPEDHLEFPELLLEPGDLLFNRTNSPELVGKSAVFDGGPKPCSFASYLIRVRFLSGIEPRLISYFLNSVHGRQWIKSVVSQQVGQANVNGTKLQSLSVPLPSMLEQKEIISLVESRLSVVYRIEKELEINLRRAERLRQSILKKAFSGQLLRNGVRSTI